MSKIELHLSCLNDNCFKIHLLRDDRVQVSSDIPGILSDFPLWRLSFSDESVVAGISDKLHLDFFVQPPGEGRVCFVESSEIRNDFRTYFTMDDLKRYIHAALKSELIQTENKNMPCTVFLEIPYPTDLDHFWEMVELGN